MNRMNRFLALAVGVLVAGSASADWIEDSDKIAMAVLRSQAAFQPESVARAGLSEFDADVSNLNANYIERQDAIMDDWSHEAITWALTVHEARPRHELQFASLVENGTSLARAMFAFNSANAEGWGAVC